VHPVQAAEYALVLAKLGDGRAADTAAAVERKAATAPHEALGENGLAWYVLAKAYALLGESEAAVRCLFAQSQRHPQVTADWVTAGKNRAGDPFVRIRGDALFTEFETQLLSRLRKPNS
jgi:hypothetical protein